MTPEVIAYNSHAVTAADAPKDWDDVVDPKWKGKVLIRNPVESGTMRAIFGAMLARSIAQTGTTAQGWDWLRKLDANTKEYVLNPALLYQKLGREEGVITLYNMPDIATLEARTKTPVGFVFPSERHAAARGRDRARARREAAGAGEAVLRVRHDAAGVQGCGGEVPAHPRADRSAESTRCPTWCAGRGRSSRRCRWTRSCSPTASTRG